MHRKWFGKLWAAGLIAAQLLVVSCSDDPASSKPAQQPNLPPAASMIIDFSSLTNPGSAPKMAQAGVNYLNAVARLAVINGTVVVVLSAPAAVFAAAVSQTPTAGSDGAYHWQYTTTANGIAFTADLTGSIDARTQESLWEMRVSAPSVGLTNFLWYDGRAKLNNSSGYWEFYDPAQPDTKVNVLHLDWTYASATNATLSFEVVKESAPEKGDTLDYTLAGNIFTVKIFDASTAENLEISWDRTTTAGYLIAPNYNGGQKACWDSTRADVACQ